MVEPSLVIRIRPHGPIHAAVQTRGLVDGQMWVRAMCEHIYRLEASIESFDYRYRPVRLCRHLACRAGFKVLNDG